MTVPPAGPILGDDDLLRTRMRALGFAVSTLEETDRDVMSVVDRLFALQGQDWRTSKWAIGVRAPGITSADVDEALNSGSLVRSWPMRGTVHLIGSADIGWMQQLTNARVIAGAAKRREFLGLSDLVLDRVTEVTVAALSDGNSLDRGELSIIWTEAGIDWKPNWRYHLIWWLCQTGITTFGPVHAMNSGADPEPRLVLASDWIREPRMLEGDDALAELARRYVQGRGAVTQKDLASWAMIPAASAKRALALALELGTVVQARRAEVSGAAGALWVDPHCLDTFGVDATAPLLALPAFDEHLLGYNIREPQLVPDQLSRIIPGKNGVFKPTIVQGGRVTGTWNHNAKTHKIEISALPGESIDADALTAPIARWSAFSSTEITGIVAV